MASAQYLVTFRPRCWRHWTPDDQDPPFCDGSIRREPDFEHEFPSITALCRGRMFAPRLHVGDRVIYATKKGRYIGNSPGWHVVAGLEVAHRFESHNDAACWYQEQGLDLPSNCMLRENGPLLLERTHGERERSVREWDSGYRVRARAYPVFLVCKPLRMDLVKPTFIDKAVLNGAFGLPASARVPSTQAGLRIEKVEFENLLAFLPRRIRRGGRDRKKYRSHPSGPTRVLPNGGIGARRTRPGC